MAGKIPQQFIDDLISRVDIVDIINTRLPLRKAGRDFMACCPFHDEKTPSFSVSQEKQFFYCFGCGASGSAIGFLLDYEHMDFVEAVHELAAHVNLVVPVDAQSHPSENTQSKDLFETLGKVADFYQRTLKQHDQSSEAINYLKGRGLSGEVAARFGVGFAPPGWDALMPHFSPRGEKSGDKSGDKGGNEDTLQGRLFKSGMLIKKDKGGFYDRFRNRIMFPIHDPRGRVIGFGGRAIDDSTPKYLNSPETPLFQKGQELYGLYQVKKSHEKLDRLIVVEGYMDVIGLAQFNINNAVATLGTATTRQHLERIYRLVSEVVFCFDGDRAGRDAAWRALDIALPLMKDGRKAKFMFLPEKEDPDSFVRQYGKDEFLTKVVNSVPLSQFLYGKLMEKADTDTIDGRSQLVELARPLLEKIPGHVFRYMMIEELAEKVHMDAKKLSSLIEGSSKAQNKLKRPKEANTLTKAAKRVNKVANAAVSYPTAASALKGQNPPFVRKAIRMLLDKPALAQHAGNIDAFRTLNRPGIDLLVQMIELLHRRTDFTSGHLIEHWRGSQEGRSLEKLLLWQPDMLNVPMEVEFSDTLKQLAHWTHQQEQQQQRQLIDSKPFAEWSTEEKQNYGKSLLSD